MNELRVIGAMFYTQRILGSPRASCEKIYGGMLFDVQNTILEKDQRFFRHSFITNRFRQCLEVANVSFCLNNREIWDKMCWLTSLFA